MSTKALKKQLMAAIAMVLVAAVALGSSTYAWFAQNNVVTADKLSIKATTEGNALVISDTSGGTTADTVGTSTELAFATEQELYPTHVSMAGITNHSISGKANSWTHAYSDKFDTAITAATSEVTLTITENSGVGSGANTTAGFSGNVYITDDMYIAVKAGGSYDHLYVSNCDITGSSQLLNAARVLLVVTDKNSAIKSYVFSANGVLKSEGSASDIVTTAAFDTLGTTTIDLGPIDSTEMHVQAFVYFDGRDEACTSALYDASKISVAFEFTGAND